MNIVLSDPKEGKAYNKKTEEAAFIGKKLGETISLDIIGLKGYKAVIAGGSDKDGFPMKPSIDSQGRKKILMTKGIGVKGLMKGERRRKRVRGNTIAKDIHQLNLKITEYGPDKLSDIFKKTGEEKKAEAKDEEKK
jgi:small subunit ribosomal protein S6e